MQQTLVLLKPDCVQRRLVGAIIGRLEQKGLRLAGLKLVQASAAGNDSSVPPPATAVGRGRENRWTFA